jgi:hypothetical protein
MISSSIRGLKSTEYSKACENETFHDNIKSNLESKFIVNKGDLIANNFFFGWQLCTMVFWNEHRHSH